MSPLLFKKTDLKKVLIIEDEPNLLKVLKIRVEAAGYDVFTASDAYHGIQSAVSNRPDLIVLDLMIPAGGGHSVLKSIRTSLKTRTIPVVVLTGARDEELKSKVLAEGVEAYLEKPYAPEEFLSILRELMDRRKDADSGKA